MNLETNSPADRGDSSESEIVHSAAGDSVEGSRSYQVIARRYRPRFFAEVVGQEGVAESLRQAMIKGRLAHAYLFCGPRGVGKTSMARIFARALQCANAVDGNPCDDCETCANIFRGEDMDVVEMDGASNRGIDDVRELIQHVRFAPTSGKFRIFIIDEVHMLTREAFNALLKTLEEPPAHVKFIFATTEPEKILATVLSRCQRCDFSAISRGDIVRRLQQICAEEKADPQPELLEQIADLARGGMRDSQSMLDQLLSFAGNTPTLEDLNHITGRFSSSAIAKLADLIEQGDRAAIVRESESLLLKGADCSVIGEQLSEEYRRRLHEGVARGWGNTEIDQNLLAQEILQEARLRMHQIGRSEVVFELALLRLSTLSELLPLAQWREAQPKQGAVAADSARAPIGDTGLRPEGRGEGGSAMLRASAAPASAVSPASALKPSSTPPSKASSSSKMALPAADPALAISPSSPPYSGAVSTLEPASDSIALTVGLVQECMENISTTFLNVAGAAVYILNPTTVELRVQKEKLVQKKKVDELGRALKDRLGKMVKIAVVVASQGSSSEAHAAPEFAGEETETKVSAPVDVHPTEPGQADSERLEPSADELRQAFSAKETPSPQPAHAAGSIAEVTQSVDIPVKPGLISSEIPETPELVNKAVEIFRGQMIGHRPPRPTQ